MNIFIDANIVYKDPFFQKSYPKKLLEYAEHSIVKIYLSDIIQDEIINNYKKELQSEYSRYKTSVKNLNNFLLEIDKIKENEMIVDDYVSKLKAFYGGLSLREMIDVIEYSNDLLPELLERSIQKKKPFATNKTELRDATFWLSINNYIKKNNLENCVLLTNNIKDFFNEKESDLHEDLRKDNKDIEVFKDIKDFFDTYDDELVPEKTNKLLDDLIEEENFDSNKLSYILNNHFATELSYEYINYFSDKHPHDLDYEIFDGYIDAEMGIECLDVQNINIDKDIYSETLIINGTAQISGFVDVYAYNPVYDRGEDKFFLYETNEETIFMEFNFSYDLEYRVLSISITKVYS